MIEILAGDGLLAIRPVLLTVIGLETAIAVFLLFGDAFWSWVVTVCTFVVFSGASAYAIVTGQDCNCISAAIGPKLMLPFDLSVLALVWAVRPGTSIRWNNRLLFEISGSLVAGLLVAGAASFYDPAANSDPLEFLLADMLVEKRWPLNARLHPELAALAKGNWMILVVRRDCEHCRELLARYFADPQSHRENERTAVFIAGDTTWPFKLDEIAIEPATQTSITWPIAEPFVASPAIFLLTNGKVIKARDGSDADEFLKELMPETP
ncbi:MAG: hypothetical protein H7Z17_04860 [Fuerstia sp.]|nr:hypothetical protein [Fuerstiella sp.]